MGLKLVGPKNGFGITIFVYSKTMYTAEDFQTAYKLFALEWAEGFMKEAFEEAKHYPDLTSFSKKIYASKKIVDEIYKNLSKLVSDDITIEQDWRNESYGDVCATFKIMW